MPTSSPRVDFQWPKGPCGWVRVIGGVMVVFALVLSTRLGGQDSAPALPSVWLGGCESEPTPDAPPVFRPVARVVEESEPAEEWEMHGEPVAYRERDGSEGSVQAFVLYSAQEWPRLELRLGDRVVFRTREVDYVSHHVVPYRGREALVVTTINGPPGTCIWSKRAQVFSLGAREVVLRHDVPLGDYLECTGRPVLACGCGEWESDWRIERRGRRVDLVTNPIARPYDGPDGRRARAAPRPRRIRLQ